MAFKVSDPIQFLGNRVKGNLDDRYGPYNFDTDINTTLQNIINSLKTGLANLLGKGLKVGIIMDNKIVEYTFQGDPSNPKVNDFEPAKVDISGKADIGDSYTKTESDAKYLTSQNISGKADKVNNATADNFAALDGNGNLKDSGKKSSDFATPASVTDVQDQVTGIKGNYVKTTTSGVDPVVDSSFDPANDCVRFDESQTNSEQRKQIARSNIDALNRNDLKTINGESLFGSGNIIVRSAYEEWLAAGNTGSEQEFLASLKAQFGSFVPADYGTNGVPASGGSDITASADTLNHIYLVNNDANTSTGKTMWITVVNDSDPDNITYGWTSIGDVQVNLTFASGQAVNTVGIDSEPTAESENLVKSSGVFDAIKNSEIIDGGPQTKAELSFVDEEDNCIGQFKEGHIKTKEFDSRDAATKDYVDNKVGDVQDAVEALDNRTADVDNIENNDEELAIVDEESNCVVLFKEGHIKTKNFDSRTAATTPSPDIVIPNNIYAVVDDTLQIFFKSILNCSNYKNYGIVVSCDIGKSFPRYYEVKPATGDIGNHNLTVHVYDTNGNIIKQKAVTLVVVDKLHSQSPAKNILAVGGSTYTSGGIISEVNRRFGANSGDSTPANPTGLGITGINFIGRKEAADIHQEATGGYSWKIYATNALKYVRFYISGVSAVNLDAKYYIEGVSTTQTYYFEVIEVNVTDGIGNILCEVYGGYIYSSLPENGVLIKRKRGGTGDAQITYSSYLFEDGNPFWHEGAVDFQHYSEQYCNGVDIDVLYTHLGLNGFYTKERVDESIENYVKPFIRKYHTDYPNGKFILGTLQLGSPNGGYGSGGYASLQQNWYNLSDVYWYTLEKYKEISESSEFSSYVSITDCTAEFDCEYGYSETNKAVNNRVSTTEVIQTNQIHPTETAKKMISDSIYRTLTKLLN